MQLDKFYKAFLAAVKSEEKNFTSGSINRTIFMLSIPMILEMVIESVVLIQYEIMGVLLGIWKKYK